MKANSSGQRLRFTALFLAIAFGLPLLCVAMVRNFAVFQTGTPNLILYGIEAMSPTLAALIVTVIFGGRASFLSFLQKCYIRNIRLKFILLAILIPFLILFATKLTLLIGDNSLVLASLTALNPNKLLILFWALIAEEIGWRGFLQEQIDNRFGFPATPILVGVVWALWHYHFFWLGTLTAQIILFVIGCIAESFGYYWITKRAKGNIIPASVWHLIGNLFFNLFLISPEYNNGSNVPYLIFVIYTAIMAVIIIYGIRRSKSKHREF